MQLKYLFLLDYSKYPNLTSPFYVLNAEYIFDSIHNSTLGKYANEFIELHPELNRVFDLEYVAYDFIEYLRTKGKDTTRFSEAIAAFEQFLALKLFDRLEEEQIDKSMRGIWRHWKAQRTGRQKGHEAVNKIKKTDRYYSILLQIMTVLDSRNLTSKEIGESLIERWSPILPALLTELKEITGNEDHDFYDFSDFYDKSFVRQITSID